MQRVAWRVAECLIRRRQYRAAMSWRLGSRHFCDNSSGISPKDDAKSQIEMLDEIIQDVQADTVRRTQESKRAMKEPTFGDLFATLSMSDTELNNWFKSEDFPEEQRPILEELSPEEIKVRLKEKRRVAEIQRLKELAESRVRVVDNQGRAYARGGRKTSKAYVWLSEGTGKIAVNNLNHDIYFKSLDHRVHILEPFCVTDSLGKFDVKALVRGGGMSGQAGAVRHAISRAIQRFDPELRLPLRRGGFLTRDPRVVERKKPGRAKARKGFQWVKR